MSEQGKKDRKGARQGPEAASVDALASRALSVVAERSQKAAKQIDPLLAERLHEAAASIDANTVPEIIEDMLNSGISAEMIAVQYIPFVARQMGDEWCEDSLSFSHVTIGVARLQSALRRLGRDWWHDARAQDTGEGSGVIVLLVKDSYHTLGVHVLAGQLRQLGLSVRLALGPSPNEIKSIFVQGEYDAVLVSSSGADSLDFLREYVETIRDAATNSPPIVVGGAVIDLEPDVLERTGADFATKDLFEALEHCGLTKTKRKLAKLPGQQA